MEIRKFNNYNENRKIVREIVGGNVQTRQKVKLKGKYINIYILND